MNAGKLLASLMPGEHPLQQLAEALEHALVADPERRDIPQRYAQLQGDDKALALHLRGFRSEGKAFLLVLDQFEELFTFADREERRHFDRQLAAALRDKDCPLFVVSTVRIDFLEGFEQLPRLSELYNAHCKRYLLKTITADGLRETIEQPARLAGLDVSEITTAILNDVRDEPGALPLVENALQVLCKESRGQRLSGALYRERGGIAGLLEEQADKLLERLERKLPGGRNDALELLLALTRVNDEGRHTRRRLPLGEALLAAGGKQANPQRGQTIIGYLSGQQEPDGGNRKANGSLRLVVVVGEELQERNPSRFRQETPPSLPLSGEEPDAPPSPLRSRGKAPFPDKGRGGDGFLSIDLIHETLIRAKGKDEATGKLVGYWKTLYDYIDKNRDRGFYRDQLARQAKEWQGKSAWGRWFNLAGWGELRAYRKLRPERGSVDERFLRRSRRMAWVQGGALALLLGFVGESYLWTLNHGFPPGYMLEQQKFRLMNWGLLAEPLPEMVDIPFTTDAFQVGDSDEGWADVLVKGGVSKDAANIGFPQIKATLQEPFALGKYEITYGQYDYYVWSQQGAEKPPEYPGNAPNESGRGQRAVVNVSWNDAQGYLQWLSTKTGDVYRLPTEVEWEYAARGGTTTGYWWGDEVGQNNANCLDCGSQWDNKFVAPIGSFKPNPFGLYDTAGNVWEWTCSEWKTDFDGSEGECTKPDAASNRRVSRGGSWSNHTVFSRPSARGRYNAGDRDDIVGLRVLRASRTP